MSKITEKPLDLVESLKNKLDRPFALSHLLSELTSLQSQYIQYFFEHLDHPSFLAFVEACLNCSGILFFIGAGKSGVVAKKIALSLSSTGSRALYLSVTNALHGDLGVIRAEDLVVLISKSGQSQELIDLVPFLRHKKVKITSIVCAQGSKLAKIVDQSLVLPLQRELCPFDLSPTTSATLQMIFGDILSVCLMHAKGFTKTHYAENHPGGAIGKRILLKVSDLMLQGEALPICQLRDKLSEVLVSPFSEKRCGCLLVVDNCKKLLGIFTDGDLRRALLKEGEKVFHMSMGSLMNPSPRTTVSDQLAIDALKLMERDPQHLITSLVVISPENQLLGLIRLHDILQVGL